MYSYVTSSYTSEQRRSTTLRTPLNKPQPRRVDSRWEVVTREWQNVSRYCGGGSESCLERLDYECRREGRVDLEVQRAGAVRTPPPTGCTICKTNGSRRRLIAATELPQLARYLSRPSRLFQRAHASVRALRFASLASGASPARMKPWPAPS
jgi:hypothetical protein